MNARQIAIALARLTPAQQRVAIRRYTPEQLVAIGNAAIALRNQGLLGLNIGSLIGTIGGALAPFAVAIPGVGPIIAAAGTAASAFLVNQNAAIAPSQPQPPQAPQGPQQSSGISTTTLLLGAGALYLLMSKRRAA